MPSFLLVPLAGAYYHPPAALILPLLPSGTKLMLKPDPTNRHDSNAVEVHFSISENNFDITTISGEALMGMGFVYDDLERTNEIMLGFLARQQGPDSPRGPAVGNTKALEFMSTHPEYQAKLAFAPDGKPRVHIDG